MPLGSAVQGSWAQQQLPPNTPVIGPKNTPGYLGPQFGTSTPAGQTKAGFVASGLPIGSQRNIEGNVAGMEEHYGGLQSQAGGAQVIQALKGNVMNLADKAATGTGADKKALVSGVLSALHIPGTGDLQSDTQLLQKQLARLNMFTPAATDAGKALVELGNPHSTMSAPAIKEAINEVTSVVEASMAARNHLTGFKYANGGGGDSEAYQKEREKIEQNADPRVWQWMSLKPGSAEAQEYVKKNFKSADQQKAFSKKIHNLEQMGMIGGGQ